MKLSLTLLAAVLAAAADPATAAPVYTLLQPATRRTGTPRRSTLTRRRPIRSASSSSVGRARAGRVADAGRE